MITGFRVLSVYSLVLYNFGVTSPQSTSGRLWEGRRSKGDGQDPRSQSVSLRPDVKGEHFRGPKTTQRE